MSFEKFMMGMMAQMEKDEREEQEELFCTMDQEDVERFEKLTVEKKATFTMFEEMKRQVMVMQKKESDLWYEMREKYQLPEADIRLDRTTKEVFVVK